MRIGASLSRFSADLTLGFKYQRFVGNFLVCHGIDVQMPRMRVGKPRSAVAEFSDEPDVVANGKVIEVKSRNLLFTDTDGLPKMVLIDTVQGQDAKRHKPLAHVIVSQHTGAMLWTPGAGADGWQVQTVNDRKRGITFQAYACHRDNYHTLDTLIPLLKSEPDAT